MTYKLIDEIAATDSKLIKQAIIKRESDANNIEFFNGLRLALDTITTFGVKQVTERTGEDGSGLSFAVFAALAHRLINRILTGDAARDAIDMCMQQATNKEWNSYYRLILIKDLKAGFSEATVNKVAADKFKIPVFECQLAKDSTDEEGNVDESLLNGRKQIDVKLDGMRVLTIVYPNGNVEQFSRNGKELVNFEVIKQQISKNASSFDVPTVLDGEVMSASFQDLMKQARRKTDVQADDTVLNLFDIIPLDEFLSGKGSVVQFVRTTMLQSWYDNSSVDMPNVTIVGSEVVNLDTAAGKLRLLEINKSALDAKLEGIMIKDINAMYECKRSYNWLKLKPFIEETLTATAIEEGNADSKFVGTMGAIVFEGVIDGKQVKVNVGGGYSIQFRAQVWADYTGKSVTWQKKVKKEWVTITEHPTNSNAIGMLGEIRADALTKSENKDTWSMRFPRFKTWRGYERGEKI